MKNDYSSILSFKKTIILWKGASNNFILIFRFTKEKTFAIIDEKLKSIKEKLPAEQQIDMEEFHMIFTRSNELIQVVDCRSQEEYDVCHISGSKRLVIVNSSSLLYRRNGKREVTGVRLLSVLFIIHVLVNALRKWQLKMQRREFALIM